MSATPIEERMDRRDVQPWADVFRRHLLPACQRVTIAGSIRREEKTVGDIEIVILPIFDAIPTLFDKGKPAPIAGAYTALENRLNAWVKRGLIAVDNETKRMGAKHRRYTATALGGRYADPAVGQAHVPGMAIDIFIADEQNIGDTELLRTGNDVFTKALFSTRRNGGLLPKYLSHHSGYLWFEPPGSAPSILPCRSEEEYFRHAKVTYIDPPDRNEKRLEHLFAEIRRH